MKKPLTTHHQRNGPIQVTGAGVRVVVILGDAIPSRDTITTTSGVAVPGEVTATTVEVVVAATPAVEVQTTTPEVGAPRNVDADNSVDEDIHSTAVSH